jgi:PhnB protein
MPSRLNPYLTFDGNAREAMEHYRDVFGGTLTLSTFGEYGAADGVVADQIMHAQLETDTGFTLMASDKAPGTSYDPGDAIAISLSGDDVEELHRYWDRLSESGTVTMPLEKQMWGDEFGQCNDRFGVPWLVNIASPSEPDA